jgi:DNA adenine methylase
MTEAEEHQPLRPVFPWPGAKIRMAEWIASLMHPSQGYLEPFAGSAAVLLARERVRHETINDLDGSVVRFYRTLRERPTALIRAVRLTPYSEEEFALALQPLGDDEIEELGDVEVARRFYVRTAQAFQGSAAWPSWGMTAVLGGGSSRAAKWQTLNSRMEEVAVRLQGVQVTGRNALSLLKQYAAASGRSADYELAIYCDPPYATEDVKLRYQHHDQQLGEELAEVLHDMGPHVHVLVSGYPGLYDTLYNDWQRIERQVLAMGGSGGEEGKGRGGGALERTEVIWSNRPTWPGVYRDS